MLKVKALGILDAGQYITERWGPEGHDRLQAALGEADHQAFYGQGLTPLTWVDANAVLQHLLTFDRVLGQGDGQAAEALLRHVASTHFGTIYRLLFRGLGPRLLLSKLPVIWERYYDQGRCELEFTEARAARCRVYGTRGLLPRHELLFIPYMEEVLRLCGAQEVSIKHVECVLKGAECCTLTYRWS